MNKTSRLISCKSLAKIGATEQRGLQGKLMFEKDEYEGEIPANFGIQVSVTDSLTRLSGI